MARARQFNIKTESTMNQLQSLAVAPSTALILLLTMLLDVVPGAPILEKRKGGGRGGGGGSRGRKSGGGAKLPGYLVAIIVIGCIALLVAGWWGNKKWGERKIRKNAEAAMGKGAIKSTG